MLDAIAGEPLEAAWVAMLLLGLRPGECFALRWGDIDLEAGRLHVRQVIKRGAGNSFSFGEPKTPRSRRTLDMPDLLVHALKARKEDSIDQVENDIEQWLYRSGLTEMSVATLRPVLPRWAAFLRRNGVTRIPPMPSPDPADGYATNLLCLQVKQAMKERDRRQEHALRNLTRIRPFKA